MDEQNTLNDTEIREALSGLPKSKPSEDFTLQVMASLPVKNEQKPVSLAWLKYVAVGLILVFIALGLSLPDPDLLPEFTLNLRLENVNMNYVLGGTLLIWLFYGLERFFSGRLMGNA